MSQVHEVTCRFERETILGRYSFHYRMARCSMLRVALSVDGSHKVYMILTESFAMRLCIALGLGCCRMRPLHHGSVSPSRTRHVNKHKRRTDERRSAAG